MSFLLICLFGHLGCIWRVEHQLLQSTSKTITNINDIGNIVDKSFLKDTDTKLVSFFVPYYFYIVYDLNTFLFNINPANWFIIKFKKSSFVLGAY